MKIKTAFICKPEQFADVTVSEHFGVSSEGIPADVKVRRKPLAGVDNSSDLTPCKRSPRGVGGLSRYLLRAGCLHLTRSARVTRAAEGL